MEHLTNIIEAILFASGRAVAISDISEKLSVTESEIRRSINVLKGKYDGEEGIRILEFNRKIQLATNPVYMDQVAAVLNPIREKELTKTILETAAIVAYKQPITRTEIEMIRGVNSDYAVNALLDLKLIYPCGKKDAIGHPVLFATTDDFLKRFRLNTLADLPDYEELMVAIRDSIETDSYLYARGNEPDEQGDSAFLPKGGDDDGEGDSGVGDVGGGDDDGGDGGSYEIPDFLRGLDDTDIVKIS